MIRSAEKAPPLAPELRLLAVASKSEALAVATHSQAAVALTEGDVPPLWTALFDYDETEVADAGGVACFFACSPVGVASERLQALAAKIPAQADGLRSACALLMRALERSERGRVALFPVALFRGLEVGQARALLQRLTDLCDAWKSVREGLPWTDAGPLFAKLGVDLATASAASAPEPLLGRLTGCQSYLEEFLLVAEGQAAEDRRADALAVGAYGTALGRFDGVWKLMSSDCDAELRAVCGFQDRALAVGAGGAVTELRDGRWRRLQAPTTADLHALWPLDENSLCAVGDQGTVLVLDHAGWRRVEVPSRGSLRCIFSSRPGDVYIGEEGGYVVHFDGYGWKRLELPVAATVHRISAVGGTVIAAGGSEAGAEVMLFSRGRWSRDGRVPPVGAILGGWSGWEWEEGLVSSSGAALVLGPAGWTQETLPVDEVVSAGGGSTVMALGKRSGYSVILTRSEGGWRIETGVPELALHGVWVSGKAKPPRMRAAAAPAPPGPDEPDARSPQ